MASNDSETADLTPAPPPEAKGSFWTRIDAAGRRRPAVPFAVVLAAFALPFVTICGHAAPTTGYGVVIENLYDDEIGYVYSVFGFVVILLAYTGVVAGLLANRRRLWRVVLGVVSLVGFFLATDAAIKVFLEYGNPLFDYYLVFGKSEWVLTVYVVFLAGLLILPNRGTAIVFSVLGLSVLAFGTWLAFIGAYVESLEVGWYLAAGGFAFVPVVNLAARLSRRHNIRRTRERSSRGFGGARSGGATEDRPVLSRYLPHADGPQQTTPPLCEADHPVSE